MSSTLAVSSSGWAGKQPSTGNFDLLHAKSPGSIAYDWLNHNRDRVVMASYLQGILEVTYAHRIIYR
ncbi:hypothetical protein [Nodosilinea sp. FACHB-13]|uniref:hypothetical protein n=1 Tax=Cyanophyceae TaxID=3028117 RepID=UPI0016888436|nr:hypothetical protein [Nodosilinea sp. FACHB-13]MBD2108151.1 hypothetical protein [Nodosilinea sp. FACHB-13]